MHNRIGVFFSGRGSNLKSVLDYYSDHQFFIFSNKENAKGLGWAIKRGIYTETLSLKENKDWVSAADGLNKLKIKKLMLLGFMKIVPSCFLDTFNGEIINLHPSILPDFPGLDSIKKSIKAQKSVGVSLHHVNEKMDEGPLIFQSRLPLSKDINLEVETMRVHALEQNIVSRFLQLRGL